MEAARTKAARRWFGYGNWSANYWFVGIEPGGADDHASYESWLGLGGHALVDCREHHEDSNRRAGRAVTKWHGSNPPIQRTWGPLIQLKLAFEGRPAGQQAVAAYQRDHWGRLSGDTAVLELSALHAANTSVKVNRTLHRADRIAELKRRLVANRPRIAVFYGLSRRKDYEAIAGPFGADRWRWTGTTLCVLVRHPAYRFAGSPAEFWNELGAWIRSTVAGGPTCEPSRPMPKPSDSRSSVAVPKATSPQPSRLRVAPGSPPEFDPHDPKQTVSLLEQLIERHGLGQRHFALLHHFGDRSSLRQHIRYCRDLEKHFHSLTNVIVARRLDRLLRRLDAGERIDEALRRVIAEFPAQP